MKASLTFLCLLLAARGGAAEDRRPTVDVSVQLISLAGNIDDLALWDGRKATPLTLSADFFGPRLRYAGDARLQLIRPGKTDEAKDKPVGKPTTEPATLPGPVVAWLDVPPGKGPRQFILLVRPEPGQSGILAIEDDNQRFPAGSLRFLNLCDFPVTIGEGEKSTRVAAKGAAVVRPNLPSGRYFDAPIHSEEDQVRRLAYNLHFFYAADRRTLLFILPGEKGSGLIRLQPVEDPTPNAIGGSPHDGKIKAPNAKK
jgi:hypothetical protein